MAEDEKKKVQQTADAWWENLQLVGKEKQKLESDKRALEAAMSAVERDKDRLENEKLEWTKVQSILELEKRELHCAAVVAGRSGVQRDAAAEHPGSDTAAGRSGRGLCSAYDHPGPGTQPAGRGEAGVHQEHAGPVSGLTAAPLPCHARPGPPLVSRPPLSARRLMSQHREFDVVAARRNVGAAGRIESICRWDRRA